MVVRDHPTQAYRLLRSHDQNANFHVNIGFWYGYQTVDRVTDYDETSGSCHVCRKRYSDAAVVDCSYCSEKRRRVESILAKRDEAKRKRAAGEAVKEEMEQYRRMVATRKARQKGWSAGVVGEVGEDDPLKKEVQEEFDMYQEQTGWAA